MTDAFRRDLTTGVTIRLSMSSTGAQATAPSERSHVAESNGNVVVLKSDAALVPQDANALRDVYQVNVGTGAVSLVSVTVSGFQGNGPSFQSSAPRRTGAASQIITTFTSEAPNLALGDTNGVADISPETA